MVNILEMDPHVLEVVHSFIEVVVDDVYGDVAGPFAGVGDDGVKMDIGVHKADSWGAGVAVIGKFIASDSQANTMCFSLGQFDVADKVGVGFF